jgi:hypothetical protein|tara:strand:+ start:297 stop:743 length:447 start_codon:yes stop_codon:yes gene_type:complete
VKLSDINLYLRYEGGEDFLNLNGHISFSKHSKIILSNWLLFIEKTNWLLFIKKTKYIVCYVLFIYFQFKKSNFFTSTNSLYRYRCVGKYAPAACTDWKDSVPLLSLFLLSLRKVVPFRTLLSRVSVFTRNFSPCWFHLLVAPVCSMAD